MARDLHAGYRKVPVLNGISLSVPPQAVTLVLGRNGSGKSTLLKTLFGLADVMRGTVTLGESVLTRSSISERIGAGIRYIPQVGGVFPRMTVAENLTLGAGGKSGIGADASVLDYVLDVFPMLKTLMRRRAGDLSGGQQRLVAFAIGVASAPRVLLVDEPTAGVAGPVAAELMKYLGRIRDNTGAGVLLAEQNVRAACEVADEVYILRDGQVWWEGAPGELLAKPELATML